MSLNVRPILGAVSVVLLFSVFACVLRTVGMSTTSACQFVEVSRIFELDDDLGPLLSVLKDGGKCKI